MDHKCCILTLLLFFILFARLLRRAHLIHARAAEAVAHAFGETLQAAVADGGEDSFQGLLDHAGYVAGLIK